MTRPVAEVVADFLGVDRREVERLADRAPTTYRRYPIPKKRGGKRDIFHPSKETKALQYALLVSYLSKLEVHEAAVAYRKGLASPLRVHAERHAVYPFTVRLDVASFFPTITPPVFEAALRRFGNGVLDVSRQEDRKLLRRALFVRFGKKGRVRWMLAVGAPSSPAISNHVMLPVDRRLTSVAGEITGVYTRYADDLYFSTDVEGGCRRFADRVQEILTEELSAAFELNGDKTLYMSRGTRRVVTGVFLCPDGSISIGRERKRYIKHLMHRYRLRDLEEEDRLQLQGLLGFARDVEPDFINRLALKYDAREVKAASKGVESPGALPA